MYRNLYIKSKTEREKWRKAKSFVTNYYYFLFLLKCHVRQLLFPSSNVY